MGATCYGQKVLKSGLSPALFSCVQERLCVHPHDPPRKMAPSQAQVAFLFVFQMGDL